MKIGTTLYSANETYNGKWTEIAEKCDWLVASAINYNSAVTSAPSATLLYRTFGSLSMTVSTSKTNAWGDIDSGMIFPDNDTSNDSVDSTTLSDDRYIMNLSDPDYVTNKIAELDYIYLNYPLFAGFVVDIIPYEATTLTWNISTANKTYYRQLVQAFLLQIQYEFSSKIIIPNCYPITSSLVGDYSLAKIASGEMVTWSFDKSDVNWTSLFSYITAVTAAVPTGLNKYFIAYCPTPGSSMTVTAQNNADVFRLNGIKSTNLILLTDMFG